MSRGTDAKTERATIARILAPAAGLVIVAVLAWIVSATALQQRGDDQSVAAASIAAPPADTRADDEVSDEALAVRESRGVQNSYGVVEAPRESPTPAKEERKLAQQPQTRKDPVGLDRRVEVADGVVIQIQGVSPVVAEAKLPGEISGPAVKVAVKITNDSAAEITTRDVIADVFFGEDQLPGVPLISTAEDSFPITLAAGEQASASYVVVIPENAGKTIRVTVNYLASEPVAVFEGHRPSAASEKN